MNAMLLVETTTTMAPKTAQENKESDNRSSEPELKNWTELAPVHPGTTPEQKFAKEIVKMRGENARTLLVVRSKVLLAVTILAFLSVIQSGFYVIPSFVREDTNVTSLLLTISMIFHLAAAGYFLKAKDPDFTVQVLKLMLIINSIGLVLGFTLPGSLPLTLVIILLMLSAHQRIEQLRHTGN